VNVQKTSVEFLGHGLKEMAQTSGRPIRTHETSFFLWGIYVDCLFHQNLWFTAFTGKNHCSHFKCCYTHAEPSV